MAGFWRTVARYQRLADSLQGSDKRAQGKIEKVTRVEHDRNGHSGSLDINICSNTILSG